MAMQTTKAWIWGLLILCGGFGAPLWAQAAAGDEDLIEVRGKVYDEMTDAPLAGIWVRARLTEGHTATREIGGRTQTDADGYWTLVVPRPVDGQRSVTFQFFSEHYGAEEKTIAGTVRGQRRLLRPSGLMPGLQPHGRVLSEDAAPMRITDPELVCAAFVLHRLHARPIAPDPVVIADDGSFAYPWALVPGEWKFQCSSHITLSPRFTLTEDSPKAHHEVQLEAGVIRTLGGLITDDAGLPMSRVQLAVRATRDGGSGFHEMLAESDDSGRFQVTRRFARNEPIDGWHLQPVGQNDASMNWRKAGQKVVWGDENVRVTLPRNCTLTIRAKRQGTDQFVTAFDVLQCEAQRTRYPIHFQKVAESSAATGSAEVQSPGIRPHKFFLVRAKDPALGLSHLYRDFGGKKDLELVVDLLPTEEHRIAVLSEEGTPIALANVTVSLQGPEGLGETLAFNKTTHATRPQLTLNWAEGMTDDQGLFSLWLPKGRDAALTVSAPGFLSAQFTIKAEGAGGPTRCVLRRGATVTGRIGPSEWVERFHGTRALQIELGMDDGRLEGLWLVPTEAHHSARLRALHTSAHPIIRTNHSHEPIPVALDALGNFALNGIPPGQWHLQWSLCASPTSEDPKRTPVGLSQSLELNTGSTSELSIDLSPQFPRPVSVSLAKDGKMLPLDFARLSGFVATPGASVAMSIRFADTKQGTQIQGVALPGTYFLQVDEGSVFQAYRRNWEFEITPITVPTPIVVRDPIATHWALELEIKRNLKLALQRKSDGALIKGAALFRRFSDEDPGDWLCGQVSSLEELLAGETECRVSNASGTLHLRALAKGLHEIYIPRKKAQTKWLMNEQVGLPILTSQTDPFLKDLILLGKIDVQSDGQSFTLLVPDEAGWL